MLDDLLRENARLNEQRTIEKAELAKAKDLRKIRKHEAEELGRGSKEPRE